MAKSLFVLSGTLSPTVEAQTHHLPLASSGAILYLGTESESVIQYRDAGTFSNLYVRIVANNTSNTSTILTRKNASTNGNLTVSIGSGATGAFQDTTHTDAVSSGDTWNYRIVTTNTGTFTLSLISVLFESSTSTDTVTRIGSTGSYNFSGTTARYTPLGGAITGGSATEANSQVQIKKTLTAKNLAVTIASNSRTTATTVRTRKNTANGAMSISYNGGTTGVVEETSPGTNSDSLVDNDLYNFQVANGSGTQAQYITSITVSLISSSSANFGLCSQGLTTGVTQSANTTTYQTLGGQLSTSNTTQSYAQVEVRADFTFSDLGIFIGTNTVSAASTFKLQKNGSDTSLSVSITANTAGRYEDVTNTVTTSAANNDLVNLILTTGSSGTSLLTRNISVYTYVASGQQYDRPISETAVSVSESLGDIESYHKTISEPAKSVSDSLTDIESYHKSITNESSISASDSIGIAKIFDKPISESSITVGAEEIEVEGEFDRDIDETPAVTVGADSIEGTKIPAVPTNKVFDVHFVEFPEEVSDSVTAPPAFQLIHVTVAKTHKYSVIKQITTLKTHIFSVLEQVTQTKIHKFSLVNQIILSKTHKFNLVSRFESAKAHRFTVIGLVTKTKTHLYNVIGLITRTKTHKYDVIGLITTLKTHVFSVLTSLSQTKTHKFNVLKLVLVTKTHKYNVSSSIIRVTTTKTHKYDIESPFISVSPPATKTHKFAILAQITKLKTHVFSVLEQVPTTKTHKFSVIRQIIQTKTHKFSVIITTSSNKTHIYDVIQRIDTTKTHKYNVIALVTRSKTHKYHAEGLVTTTKTHKFDIEAIVGTPTTTKTHIFSIIERITKTKTHIFSLFEQIVHTRTHKYHVATLVTQPKTHKFSIIQRITVTKTHKYHVTNRVTPDLTRTHVFSISTLATRTRTHKFNIVGRLTTTKTHRYGLGGAVSTTKTHKYDVGLGVALKELGGSTNAFVRFQDRVRIIDIISDLNNTAIANIEIPVPRPPTNIAIATVAIAEYVPGSRLLTASVYKPRHRVASQLIIPQIIDTIDNLAIAPYIGIEELPLSQHKQFQTRSHISIHETYPRIHVASQTQLSQNDKTKIRIASSTMLQQTPITRIESKAQLEIPTKPSPVLAPEIMTKQKAKILRTLINILSSDKLFE